MNTRHTFIAAMMLGAGVLHAQSDVFDAWTHRAPVQVNAPGLTRLELPPEVLDASLAADSASVHDLRLTSPSGVETPILIEWPRFDPGRSIDVGISKATLQGATTVLEFAVPEGVLVQELGLSSFNRNFIKATTLEGMSDGSEWRVISDRELIFQQGDARRVSFTFPPFAWEKLRVTLDDQRSEPVGFIGAVLVTHERDETPSDIEDLRILSREEAPGETLLTLDLGGRHRPLHSLHLVVADPLFQRDVKLERTSEDGRAKSVAAGSICRAALDGRHTEDLDFMTRQIIPERVVKLRILNDGNPPLRLEKVRGRFLRVGIVFHAETAGTWQLLIGNPNPPMTRYDVAKLLGEVDKVTAASGRIGELEPNPGFRKEATLPESGEGGAMLDVTAWAYRKSVTFSETGVLRVELDAEALAHAAPDQRDVRVMQEGRQVPFLIQRGLPVHEAEVKFHQEPDPKRPTVSRWRIALPFPGHPVSQLIATSTTALFSRQMHVWEDGRDAYGNRFRRPLGSASWQRTSGQADAERGVTLPSHPTGDVIYLETDNGDNAPLQLQSVRVAYQPVAVVFQTTDTAPVQLVYGNPRASAPRYDIQLVRAQFERADQTNATLGAEERTAGHEAREVGVSGVGSAWLWGALALVVGGLLWIVARLLPAETKAE